MANEDPQPDIQALVDAAVRDAVAKSLAEMSGPKSRQEIRNEERAKRQEDCRERREEKKAPKAAQGAPVNDPVEDKGKETRKAQNQNLGQQEPVAQPVRKTKQETERKLDIAKAVGPLHEPAARNGFNPREFLLAAKSQAINHPWRVYNVGTDVMEGSPEVIGKYGVIGGTVYSQGGDFVVADKPEIIGGSGTGETFIYLEITRNPSSRAVNSVTVELGETVPVDTASTQYRPLAIVYGTSGQKPLQLQFGEIRVWELMLVENGEFALHTFDTNNRTSYSPP